ncbi:MAG: endonuclease domain-containing protein [Rhizomicrobium sp.]
MPKTGTVVHRALARTPRQNATDAERKLWTLLRRKRLADCRFRRQQPIGPYIADFYCSMATLVVELDRSQHAQDARRNRDFERTKWLELRGYQVLRFWNADVLTQPDVVTDTIFYAVERRTAWKIPLPENPAR